MNAATNRLNGQSDDITGMIHSLITYGYYELGNPPYAEEIFKRIKARHPLARMLRGFGNYGIRQVIYLPSYYPLLVARIKTDLRSCRRAAVHTGKAYRALLRQHDQYLKSRRRKKQ